MHRFLTTLPVLAVLAFAMPAGAQLEDDLSTVKNFAKPFGSLSIEADAQTKAVTLIRQAAQGDAGVDWLIEGKHRIPLTEAYDYLRVEPTEPVAGGYYVLSLLFFDNQGEYIAEHVWQADTQAAKPRILTSVAAFAKEHEVASPATYQLRIRINPVDKAGAGFHFTHIAATAQPVERSE